MALLARLAGSLLLAAGTASGGFVKAGHWNLYWRALGNPDGRKAIVESLDEAASGGPFDFLSLVEASGSAPGGFPAWLEESKALRSGGGMARLSGQSGHETIALLYRATEWDEKYSHVGDMGTGRPYLLALFRNRASPLVWTWVLSIHTPHWPQVGLPPRRHARRGPAQRLEVHDPRNRRAPLAAHGRLQRVRRVLSAAGRQVLERVVQAGGQRHRPPLGLPWGSEGRCERGDPLQHHHLLHEVGGGPERLAAPL
mmetsp:Transcript_95948/g.298765  ORF Transcript_95948/g.298765 Transcript_95948/m.298765 type:complete len:255 (+) Transcript_95948:127-891(+)